MKNKLTILLAVAVMFMVCVGCSLLGSDESSKGNRPANQAVVEDKSTAEKAIDLTLGEHTVGIPECDQLFNSLAAYADSPEDDFVTRAAKRALANKIRQSLKQNIEENKHDKTQLANDCRQYKTQLDNFQSLQN